MRPCALRKRRRAALAAAEHRPGPRIPRRINIKQWRAPVHLGPPWPPTFNRPAARSPQAARRRGPRVPGNDVQRQRYPRGGAQGLLRLGPREAAGRLLPPGDQGAGAPTAARGARARRLLLRIRGRRAQGLQRRGDLLAAPARPHPTGARHARLRRRGAVHTRRLRPAQHRLAVRPLGHQRPGAAGCKIRLPRAAAPAARCDASRRPFVHRLRRLQHRAQADRRVRPRALRRDDRVSPAGTGVDGRRHRGRRLGGRLPRRRPRPKRYSWWSNWPAAFDRNLGWRIDYQLVTPDLKPLVRAAVIDRLPRFSDHAPVTIDYDLPG